MFIPLNESKSQYYFKVYFNFNFQNKFPSVYSDISRIEHAIAACQCVIRHQFLLDAVKHKNGRVNYKGSLMINNIVIARGSAVSKKNCKRITYTNALERLLKEPIQELLKPVAEDDESEVLQSAMES